ncbi:MAG: N-acetylmuramoyl-L-alanine amidase [Blautia sp.]|nr:N-acetylmuramoyl-L-alanine amidase [Blautia sp.]
MTEAEKRARERIENSRLRRQRQLRQNAIICVGLFALVLVGAAALVLLLRPGEKETAAPPVTDIKYIPQEPEIDVELLPINDYSRPGTPIEKVTGIVIHYTANPGTTAMQNRDYFAGLAQTHTTSASSHFIIGLEGEIVQCIPCNEIAYATKERNIDTISIECCIEEESGRFNAKTYASLVQLVTWLMGRYELDVDAVIRHYDVTGKNCPKYYVENESSWRLFKSELTDYIEKNGVARPAE